jgi:hypothetical protein
MALLLTEPLLSMVSVYVADAPRPSHVAPVLLLLPGCAQIACGHTDKPSKTTNKLGIAFLRATSEARPALSEEAMDLDQL